MYEERAEPGGSGVQPACKLVTCEEGTPGYGVQLVPGVDSQTPFPGTHLNTLELSFWILEGKGR